MSPQKLPQQMAEMALVLLLLIGCTAPAATKPPAAAPTRAFKLATSAAEVVGTWVSGRYYIRFDADGTFRMAHVLAELDSQPYNISAYQLEGAKMVTTEIRVVGVPTCGAQAGTYELRLLENGNLWIVVAQDPCAQRSGDIQREYVPVR